MRGSTRREFLAAAAGGTLALTLPGRALARAWALAGSARDISTFRSVPSLKPPTVEVLTRTTPAPGYLFVASLNGPGQRGPLIVDDRGRVVWFKPVETVAINFRRQTYLGKPVLTWWEGTISQQGIGEGELVIVDDTYTEVARVQAGNGYKVDVHEQLLTPQGTLLLTAYDTVPVDVGSAAAFPTLDSIVQEVDVKTGAVLFEWHSLEHVPIADSYAPLVAPFDYFHVNSIDVDLDGNLLVSARNTSAIYKLDRTTGRILWRLGGRSSDFTLGPGVRFMYQHDARGHADGTLTLFDDGPGPSSEQARALRLGLDLQAMHAIVLQQYTHPTPLDVSAMGNAQLLEGDAVLVGWGTQPYLTEFGPGGDVRLDAKFTGDAWNYRAFRDTWRGRPAAPPAVAAQHHSRGTLVYASWNGTTETAHWRVSGGPTPAALQPLKVAPASGFETEIALRSRPAYVAVTALDARKRALASSHALRVR